MLQLNKHPVLPTVAKYHACFLHVTLITINPNPNVVWSRLPPTPNHNPWTVRVPRTLPPNFVKIGWAVFVILQTNIPTYQQTNADDNITFLAGVITCSIRQHAEPLCSHYVQKSRFELTQLLQYHPVMTF